MQTDNFYEQAVLDNRFETSRLCHVRKRSVEIPLDNLLSGILYLDGGRDKRDGPVLSVVQPEDVDMAMLMDLTVEEIIDMLAYFTFVPSEEVRSRKFTVIVAVDCIHDYLLKKIIKALCNFQSKNKLFFITYFISAAKDRTADLIEWAYSLKTPPPTGTESDDANQAGNGEGDFPTLKHSLLPSNEALHEFISPDQLTPEFGGTKQYDHHDWVRFRMQVEPFICDMVSVSKKLAQTIAPFTKEDLPETIQEAEESIKEHHLQRRKTMESLHVDDLASEGEKIRQRMHSPSKEQYRNNPDFLATLDTVDVLLERVESVRTRLDSLWTARYQKLEVNLKQRKFEKEAHQLIEWFEQYAEEFFETHTEIGDSLEVVQALVGELQEFESSAKQVVARTDQLLKNATDLEGLPYVSTVVKELASKINDLITDFQSRLDNRKKNLENASRLHTIMEKAIDWCIKGVAFLSDYDIVHMNAENIDPRKVQIELQHFQNEFPPPKKDDIKFLNDAVAAVEGCWGREHFQFALNRILELNDRFEFYHKILEEMVEEKHGEERDVDKNGLWVKPLKPAVSKAVQQAKKLGLRRVGSAPTIHKHHKSTGNQDLPDGQSSDSPDGGLQISVVDVDVKAHEALDILETTARHASKLSSRNTSSPTDGDFPGSDSMSLTEFLDSIKEKEHTKPGGLMLPEMRARSYSAPDDGMDLVELPERALKHHVNKQEISGPSNPQFEEEPEHLTIEDDKDIMVQDDVIEKDPQMEAQAANAKQRRRIMEEVLSSENKYIEVLDHVCSTYMPAMDNLADLPKCLAGKKGEIFGLVSDLLNFTKNVLLPKFHKCARAPIKIGLVFLDHEEDFLQYAMYFKQKPTQDKLVEESLQFFSEIQERAGDPLPLPSLLIKPIQRMSQYKLFLKEMIKYCSKGMEMQGVQKGAKKEYFDKLKEAYKMVDFVLRHGNDLLALESLKGFDGSFAELGRVLRVGNLAIVDGFTKHHRKVFLFEQCIIFSKTRRTAKSGPAGTDVYDYKNSYRTSSLVLRETIPGHEKRFALDLNKSKLSIELAAPTVEEKGEWVQEIWDLFFSHMLKLRETNLESHHTKPLSSNATGFAVATLGRSRPFSHSMRRARISTLSTTRRMSKEVIEASMARPPSQLSIGSVESTTSLKEIAALIRQKKSSSPVPINIPGFPSSMHGPISPRSATGLHYQDMKYKRMSNLSLQSGYSGVSSVSSLPGDRSSVSSISSTGTLSGATFGGSPDSTLKRNEHMYNHDAMSNDAFDDSTLKRHTGDTGFCDCSTSCPDSDPDESFKLYTTPL